MCEQLAAEPPAQAVLPRALGRGLCHVVLSVSCPGVQPMTVTCISFITDEICCLLMYLYVFWDVCGQGLAHFSTGSQYFLDSIPE